VNLLWTLFAAHFSGVGFVRAENPGGPCAALTVDGLQTPSRPLRTVPGDWVRSSPADLRVWLLNSFARRGLDAQARLASFALNAPFWGRSSPVPAIDPPSNRPDAGPCGLGSFARFLRTGGTLRMGFSPFHQTAELPKTPDEIESPPE
jgi:hypothetical protein